MPLNISVHNELKDFNFCILRLYFEGLTEVKRLQSESVKELEIEFRNQFLHLTKFLGLASNLFMFSVNSIQNSTTTVAKTPNLTFTYLSKRKHTCSNKLHASFLHVLIL